MMNICLVVAAAMCGFAWGHPDLEVAIGAAAVVPALWHRCSTRWSAGAAIIAYQLAASRGLPAGAAVFFGNRAPAWCGFALWAAAALTVAMPWTLIWTKLPVRRAWLLPVNMIVATLPPVGIIAWASPLTAAGVWFPGFGFAGLALLVLANMACARGNRAAATAVVAVAIVTVCCAHKTPELRGWAAVDTAFPDLVTGPGGPEPIDRILAITSLMTSIDRGEVRVLPESVLPPIDDSSFGAALLTSAGDQLAARGGTLLVGTEIDRDNVLRAFGISSAALQQRVPVPISMWRPWSREGFRAHLLGRGVTFVAGRPVAELICYEQVLTYPVLISMLWNPQAIVGAANDWWARDTSIPTIQGQASDLWGALFSTPVIRATNL